MKSQRFLDKLFENFGNDDGNAEEKNALANKHLRLLWLFYDFLTLFK